MISAPHATATPAVWSSMPNARLRFLVAGEVTGERRRSARGSRARSRRRRRDLSEPPCPLPFGLHPEAALEVDLARGIAMLEEDATAASGLSRFGRRDGRSGSRPRRSLPPPSPPVRPIGLLPFSLMGTRPTRIELLELDIDVRLADLWARPPRSASGTSRSWPPSCGPPTARSYCDALTEERSGQPLAATTGTRSRSAVRRRRPRSGAFCAGAGGRLERGQAAQSRASRRCALARGGPRGVPAVPGARESRHTRGSAERARQARR